MAGSTLAVIIGIVIGVVIYVNYRDWREYQMIRTAQTEARTMMKDRSVNPMFGRLSMFIGQSSVRHREVSSKTIDMNTINEGATSAFLPNDMIEENID